MKLPEVNNWLTLLANVGVLTGIVFLAIELDQSNRIAIAAAEADIRAAQRELLLATVENPELSEFVTRSQSFETIPPEDRVRYDSFVTMYFSMWAGSALQYENGLLSEYSLEVNIRSIRAFLHANPAAEIILRERIDQLGLERGMNVVWDALFDELESLN